MDQPVIYFSHGMESSPKGTKIRVLSKVAESHGYSHESIDYTDTFDPDIRAERLIRICQEDSRNKIFVGSSMGAYVSLCACKKIKTNGLFLMAPALYLPGYKQQEFNVTSDFISVIHGFRDEVIPFEHSIRFSKQHLCDLHLINSDHRLNDRIKDIEILFKYFLIKMTEFLF
jgi:predicted esterase